MKRSILILLIVVVAVFLFFIIVKPLVLLIAHNQLQKIFPGSRVAIKSCNLKPLYQLSLSNIEIVKDGIYKLNIQELGVEYSFFSVIGKKISRVYIKDPEVSVDFPKGDVFRLAGYLHIPNQKSVFLINVLELSNCNLDINCKDLRAQLKVSLELDMPNQLIKNCDLDVLFFEARGIEFKKASLRLDQAAPSNFIFEELQYNRLKIDKIRSEVRLNGKDLFFDSFTAGVLDGEVKGNINMRLSELPEYSLELEFLNLDLNDFVNTFKLAEKMQMSGKIGGSVILTGKGYELKMLKGDFSVYKPGGFLDIKDKRYLENVARNSNQPLEILVESFKKYYYNTGIANLSFKQGNLILDIALEGNAGKRNLNIILHDFIISEFKKWLF